MLVKDKNVPKIVYNKGTIYFIFCTTFWMNIYEPKVHKSKGRALFVVYV